MTVTEQGLLESAENTEIKCKVRGWNTVIWVIESGTVVEPGDELVRLDTLFIEEQIDSVEFGRIAAAFHVVTRSSSRPPSSYAPASQKPQLAAGGVLFSPR